MGVNLNYLVSINWDILGVSDLDSTAHFKELKKRVSRAWKYHTSLDGSVGGFYHLEVQENPNGKTNTHWLLHVEKGAVKWLNETIENRLEKVLLCTLPDNALHMMHVPRSGTLLKYLNKGMNPLYAAHFHVNHEDQGKITGQRTNTSRNLGRNARKKNNWRRKNRLTKFQRDI
ncbi:MAG: hypothetical protein COA69_01275 [Robiginitomaculum sp.]|nr:MAG: hypothetical protein COA69_01275 [Robiginitomaculum sp.]